MLKKIINKLLFMMIGLLTVGCLSACCTPDDCQVRIVFDNVDPNMGVTTYTKSVKYGEDLNVEFVIPEGYDYETLTAKIGDLELDYNVALSNPNVEEEYIYSTSKSISLTVGFVNRDFDLVFDMSKVRKRQFDVNLSQELLLIGKSEEKTNFKIISVKEESVSNLTVLNSDNMTNVREFSSNSVSVDYGEHIILCYTRQAAHSEIPTVYSEVGHFTDESKILTTSAINYVKFDVAQRGNSYYNAPGENGISNGSTRLFYVGKVQEDINLYDSIPNLQVTKGFSIENENIFTLLTNKQDFNSEMLGINLYMPSTDSYNSSNDSLDKIGNTTIEKISKYNNESETLKNPNVVYEYLKRYDAYQLYIGENKASDSLLNATEKSSVPSVLYLKIDTQEFLDTRLDITLLSYEKQQNNDVPRKILTEFITSDKGEKFYKIDKTVLEEFLLARATSDGQGGIKPYKTGNCILYVGINPVELNNSRINHTFPYSEINFPTIYGNDKSLIVNPDYQIYFYILNADGSKDYGFQDLHKDYQEDIVYFETNKLWTRDHEGKWECLNNLYATIIGPDYNDYYSPVIERVYMDLNFDGSIFTGGVAVQDPTVLNGIQDLPVDISGLKDKPYPNEDNGCGQYGITISLTLTDLNVDAIMLDFSNLDFVNADNDSIFISNTAKFNSVDDFKKLNFRNQEAFDDIRFGSTTDIYYVIISDEPMDFDVYVGQVEEMTDNYVGIKDEKRKISGTKKLYDIAGNEVKVNLYGKTYNVYVKYQNCEVYDIQGTVHFAFNN